MELWIRTQDRELLLPAKLEMQATGSGRIGYLMYGLKDYSANAVMLGTYKSKERALEVLDEIQNLLMPIITSTPIIEEDIKPEYTYRHYVSKGSDIEVIQLNTYVYEMPKE